MCQNHKCDEELEYDLVGRNCCIASCKHTDLYLVNQETTDIASTLEVVCLGSCCVRHHWGSLSLDTPLASQCLQEFSLVMIF